MSETDASMLLNLDSYYCFLDGEFYGNGSLDHIKNLFIDYVVTAKMCGKNKCDFRIQKNI